MRKRPIKLYGNTYVIKLMPNDLEDLGFKENDEVDIEDLVKVGDKNGKKK